MKKNKSSFLKGAFILAAGGIFAKFLGIFFKIPLSYIIGNDGLGIYGLAYPIYSSFLSLSTIGFPVAVSKMVSERSTLGNYKGAYKVLKLSFLLLAVIGAAASVAMLFGANFFTKIYGTENVYYSIIALSLAPFLVAMISAIRGFFQGMQKMAYSSVSQIIDQVFRVGIGIAAAYLLMKQYDNIAYGAAGASAGATAGAAFSFLFLLFALGIFTRKQRPLLDAQQVYREEKSKDIYKTLILIALPIALGGLVTTLMSLVNSVTIMRSLLSIGYTTSQAESLVGILEQKVQTLVNVPFVIGTALSASLVPSISASYALKNKLQAVKKTSVAVKVSFIISMPAAVGLSVLAEPIMVLMFGAESASDADILRWLAYVVVFTLGMTTLQGILQGAGHYYKPIKNMLVGAVAKFALNVILIPDPDVNIYGAIFSSIFASALIFGLNYYDTKEFIGMDPMGVPIIKITLCTAVMGVIAKYGYDFLSGVIDFRIAVIAVIALCIVVYFGLIYLTKSLTKQDLNEIRG